jgi:hypothetical protein
LPANAPLLLVQPGKLSIAPSSSTAAALGNLLAGTLPEHSLGATLDYVVEGLRLFNRAKSHSLLLLVTE